MKTLKSIFIEEVQATQVAFQLIGRMGSEKLTTEEREVVKRQMIKLLLFIAFWIIPFASLLLPFIFPAFPKSNSNYFRWAKKLIPTRGLS